MAERIQQCGAVRREGDRVLRCGLPTTHNDQHTDHDKWHDIGSLSPDYDGIPLGRILDAMWEETSRNNPDAWRDPDPAGRSVEPPEPGQIPRGVQVTPLGRTRGENVSSLGEVLEQASRVVADIREGQRAVRAGIEKMNDAHGLAVAILGEVQEDSLISAGIKLLAAAQEGEGMIRTAEGAIEDVAAFGAKLGGQLG
jgi:hypothetical protein